MSIMECVRIAIGSLSANKLRTFLTMLGVIIGVGAVIAMVSLGEGAQKQVTDRISTLGADLLTVRAGRSRTAGGAGPAGAFGSANVLTYETAQHILAETQYVKAVAPEVTTNTTVSHGTVTVRSQVVGTTPDYLAVRNVEVESGRFIGSADLQRGAQVAVLGATVASELFGEGVNPVGERIRIRGKTFEVVGMLAYKGGTGMANADDTVYVPLTSAQKRLTGRDYVSTIYVQALSQADSDKAKEEITALLTDEIGDPDLFSVSSMADVLTTVQETAKTFTLLLAGIAAVSLFVGGIGIMNIMLVSVVERTREIGVRMAVGANRKHILMQFVVEALVLSVSGGLIGIGIGMAASRVLAAMGGWPTLVSESAILMAVSFSVAVGLVFGVWPASKAARLDPIEALRYE